MLPLQQKKKELLLLSESIFILRMNLISLFSAVIDLSESCSMGLVIDKNLLHYLERIFTLFQKVSHIIQIACPCSVLTVSANLFNKFELR